jgi:hypothetical protein
MRVAVVLLGLSLALGAMAFRQDPRAEPGPQPGVCQSFSEEELLEQQRGVAVAPPTGGGYEYTNRQRESPPAAPDDSSGITSALAGMPEQSNVDGQQVLQEANSSLQRSGGRTLVQTAVGFLLFAGAGFGIVACARTWVEKNAPKPVGTRTGKRGKTSRPK